MIRAIIVFNFTIVTFDFIFVYRRMSRLWQNWRCCVYQFLVILLLFSIHIIILKLTLTDMSRLWNKKKLFRLY